MKKILSSIKALLVGLYTVFKHIFKPAVTVQYPEERYVLPDKFRGKHCLHNCIGCGVCVKVCPANAINFEMQDKKVVSYKLDMKKCIFCGNCEYYCPVKAIKLTKEFELATSEHENLVLELVNDLKEEEC